jgi:hypothetical protein
MDVTPRRQPPFASTARETPSAPPQVPIHLRLVEGEVAWRREVRARPHHRRAPPTGRTWCRRSRPPPQFERAAASRGPALLAGEVSGIAAIAAQGTHAGGGGFVFP